MDTKGDSTRPILTLTTDFGTADGFAAELYGVVLARAPETAIVDVTHEVEPGDIEGAADLLASIVAAFPAATLHLAVVDPSGGSTRRLLALDSPAGRFLAPDNGLLTPFLATARELRSIERRDLVRAAASATFAGRDRLAPAAAFLLSGGRIEDLGPSVVDPVRLVRPTPERLASAHRERLSGSVVRIDRFGNAITDLPSEWLSDGKRVRVRLGRSSELESQPLREVDCVRGYAEIEGGCAAILAGSRGTLELSLREASLGAAWQIRRGLAIEIEIEAEIEIGAQAVEGSREREEEGEEREEEREEIAANPPTGGS